MHQLDTSTVVAFLRGNRRAADRLTPVFRQTAVSKPALAELFHGVFASRRPAENMRKLRALLGEVSIVPFDAAAAETYGRIRDDLDRRGQPIGEMDLLIGSVAVTHGATLVTHNTRHFARIDGLRVEDWLAEPT